MEGFALGSRARVLLDFKRLRLDRNLPFQRYSKMTIFFFFISNEAKFPKISNYSVVRSLIFEAGNEWNGIKFERLRDEGVNEKKLIVSK